MADDNGQKTCFVVMGFGKKTDFETGRVLDLDRSYKYLIKPAVEAAGLKCIRADEIVHSGIIDVPMYEQLLTADVVVADLSTSNKNAYYELGVRHALRPYTTVVICEDGVKSFPFDVNHVVVRQYHHLGEDIGVSAVLEFGGMLTKAIKEISEQNPRQKDSPVYTFLNRLNPPELAKIVEAVANNAAMASPAPAATGTDELTHSVLMQQVEEAQKKGNWIVAKSLLSFAIGQKQKAGGQVDPYLLQKLALITYKSEQPTGQAALEEAKSILKPWDPDTSNDTETLGLWGAIHKRLFDITKDLQTLDEAVRAYERGFYLRNDFYNGINYAYLLNVRAGITTNHAEAIADFVQAQRVRKEVLMICENILSKSQKPATNDEEAPAMKEYRDKNYWVLATQAEAYIGIGEEAKGQSILEDAYKHSSDWMVKSTKDQLAKLKPLLEKSPLSFVLN
ncbi:MAG: hypothetical protein JWQ96_2484 [Segetibacter sp.]|nr:hypothetical protein [Segetibacter sp.]